MFNQKFGDSALVLGMVVFFTVLFYMVIALAKPPPNLPQVDSEQVTIEAITYHPRVHRLYDAKTKYTCYIVENESTYSIDCVK